jgi:hypothetical protein
MGNICDFESLVHGVAYKGYYADSNFYRSMVPASIKGTVPSLFLEHSKEFV